MPNSNRALPIICPKCQHYGCMLVVQSLTVMMCRCAGCLHTWAAELETLPLEIQRQVRLMVREL